MDICSGISAAGWRRRRRSSNCLSPIRSGAAPSSCCGLCYELLGKTDERDQDVPVLDQEESQAFLHLVALSCPSNCPAARRAPRRGGVLGAARTCRATREFAEALRRGISHVGQRLRGARAEGGGARRRGAGNSALAVRDSARLLERKPSKPAIRGADGKCSRKACGRRGCATTPRKMPKPPFHPDRAARRPDRIYPRHGAGRDYDPHARPRRRSGEAAAHHHRYGRQGPLHSR